MINNIDPCENSYNKVYPCLGKMSDPSDKCCIASLIKVFDIIKLSTKYVSQNSYNGFSVNILVTTVNGNEYTMLISPSAPTQLVISKYNLIYGNLILSLEHISKVIIQSGSISDPTFVTILTNLLNMMTTCPNQ